MPWIQRLHQCHSKYFIVIIIVLMWFVCSVTNEQLCHGKSFSSCHSWGCFQQHWKLWKGHGCGHISSWWWSVGEKNVVFLCSCTYSANRGIPFWSQNSYYIALLRFCANIIISLTLWESVHKPIGNSVPYYDCC